MGWTFRRGASKETIIHDILEPWDTTATEETAKSAWYDTCPERNDRMTIKAVHA